MTDRRMQIFENALSCVPTGSLVDLGAGHGAFARRAADLGWQVTAVDARRDRFPDDPRVTWVEADVRTVDVAPFDLVVCLGLFYHLTLDDQLDLLDRVAGRPLLLDTHVANGASRHALSDEVTQQGYTGRFYKEGSGLRSSWRNVRSFWPTPESLHRMLAEHGYPVVFACEPWYLPDRTFFLTFPQPQAAG